MTVRIRLFAILRQRAGAGELTLELAEGATVTEALQALDREGPLAGLIGRLPVRMAVNREYASDDTPLSAGDELALIPPVSGGGGAAHTRVTAEPLAVEALARLVARPQAGALVIFCGVTREVERLEYEAYREMASAQLEEIAAACLAEHGCEAIAIEHRVGRVALGEPSVVVAVSAAHREEAFAGARAAIDRVKGQVAIWKAEVEDGARARWVAGSAPAQDGSRAGQGGAAAGATAGAGAGGGPQSGGAEAPALTHVDPEGSARMVHVGSKQVSERRALARGRVRVSQQTAAAIVAGEAPKGEVFGTARLAGIQAAKRCAELIPLAHPLPLTFVDVHASVDARAGLVELISEARATARTGVELEAMTACSVAALTVYDMVKGVERGVRIEEIVLLEKSGGRHDWRLEEGA
jgi:molybdenum cofactor biosynthesis protein MoaC/molybdopterin converting factor subunit 1